MSKAYDFNIREHFFCSSSNMLPVQCLLIKRSSGGNRNEGLLLNHYILIYVFEVEHMLGIMRWIQIKQQFDIHF